MTVKIETDAAQVATYFTGLQETSTGVKMKINFTTNKTLSIFLNNSYIDAPDNDRSHLDITMTQPSTISSTDSIDTAEVRLDIKKFAQLLSSQQPHAEKMVFSTFIEITAKHYINLLLYFRFL